MAKRSSKTKNASPYPKVPTTPSLKQKVLEIDSISVSKLWTFVEVLNKFRLTNAPAIVDALGALLGEGSIIFIGATFVTLQIFIYADSTFDIFVIDPNTDARIPQGNTWFVIGVPTATKSYTQTLLLDIVAHFCRALKENTAFADERSEYSKRQNISVNGCLPQIVIVTQRATVDYKQSTHRTKKVATFVAPILEWSNNR